MENNLAAPAGKKQIVIMGIVVLAVIVIVVVWFSYSARKARVESPASKEVSSALLEATEKAKAPEVSVPTSANPIKQSLPKETPQQKTNPFNKVYANPFE